jgi:predicted NAD-dependent protein-ADP-ribosyltransferase YbiA (DUF1768 family)
VIVNVYSKAKGLGAILSNFARTPFVLDGVECASMEGFIQGLKVEEPAKQRSICARHGARAKRAGTKVRNRKAWNSQTVWWQGHPVPYRSEAHFELIRRALEAKFDQDRTARDALIATGDAELIHDTGKPESPRTSLPAARLLAMLRAIRTGLLRA